MAGGETGPADPYILQQPQVRDLVATVALVQPRSHLVFVGLDAAHVKGLLGHRGRLGVQCQPHSDRVGAAGELRWAASMPPPLPWT